MTDLLDQLENDWDGFIESLQPDPKSLESIMCPHGFNRLAMKAFGQHCAHCPPDQP